MDIYIPRMATGIQPTAPLTPAVLAILLSLAEGEKHGYAMMKDARTPERGGQWPWGPEPLYGSIERMMRDGSWSKSRARRTMSVGDNTASLDWAELSSLG